MTCVDLAVVGAGIVGASAAWHVAQRGQRVALIGDHRPGTATTAAVGMLTPTCEWETYEPREWLSFLRDSARYYPEFLEGLGLDTHEFASAAGYRETEFLMLDFHDRSPAMTDYTRLARELGSDCDYLEPDSDYIKRSGANAELIRGATRVRGEAIVDPRRLSDLLYTALARLPVAKVINETLIGAESTAAGPLVLRTNGGQKIEAEKVLIAGGSWSCEVGELFSVEVPVFPVRGQIIALSGPPGLLDQVLYLPVGACGCLLERSPGEYICGTSEEYRAGTAENTVDVVATILDRVRRTFPVSKDWQIRDMWAGFRPQTADRLPLIGPTTNPQVLVATGHFRNGILAGPHTGRLIANHLAGAAASELALYSPDRPLSDPISIAARF